jgi:hypothetical protein
MVINTSREKFLVTNEVRQHAHKRLNSFHLVKGGGERGWGWDILEFGFPNVFHIIPSNSQQLFTLFPILSTSS